MSDIDRAVESIYIAEVTPFAEAFVRGVLNTCKGAEPPCSGGDRSPWTSAVKNVLAEVGTKAGYEAYGWEPLLDFIWWRKSEQEEQMILAVESELDKTAKEIEADFQKLPSFKCPRKLLVFSTDKPAEIAMKAARFMQHIAGEEYYLVNFTATGAGCYFYRVPEGGRQEMVRFKPLNIRVRV